MNELIRKLAAEQPVQVSLRPENNLQHFRAALDRGYVHVLFTETRGGTELGVPVDGEASDCTNADLEKGSGRAHLEGELVLDYVPVRFVGDLDVDTLKGRGRLIPLEEPQASRSTP